MESGKNKRPDSIIVGGEMVFDLWISKTGIKRIQLPPLRSEIKERINPDLHINIYRYFGFHEREWIDQTADMLKAMISGRPSVNVPPVDISRLSDFARSVLERVAEIPWGEVRSYRWVAERCGRPRAARAVGGVLKRNPVPLLVPCHRVIMASGALGGFASGPDWKRWLIALEESGRGD